MGNWGELSAISGVVALLITAFWAQLLEIIGFLTTPLLTFFRETKKKGTLKTLDLFLRRLGFTCMAHLRLGKNAWKRHQRKKKSALKKILYMSNNAPEENPCLTKGDFFLGCRAPYREASSTNQCETSKVFSDLHDFLRRFGSFFFATTKTPPVQQGGPKKTS